MKKNLNYLWVGLILIGLPFFAWYYLSKGTEMRKSAMKELEPKGAVGNFQSVTDSDSLFYSENLKGHRWIVGIIGADSLRRSSLEILKNIYNQSKEEFSVKVFTIIGLYSGEFIPEMGAKLRLPREANWINTYMADKHVFVFAEDAFVIPPVRLKQDLILLVDEKGTVRQYYSLANPEEVKKMARQVPVFLSLK